MSDINEESRNFMERDVFHVGDSVIAYTHPLTEGLIVSKTVTDDGKLVLTLIVAPHQKKGHDWTRAAVSVRDAARLSKKTPINFAFPIKDVETLRSEARRAKGDNVWVFSTTVKLDREFEAELNNVYESQEEDHEFPDTGEDPKKLSYSARKGGEQVEVEKNEFEQRLEDIILLKEGGRKKKGKTQILVSEEDSNSDFEAWKQFRKQRKQKKKKKALKKKKRKSNSDSSSSSSSSSSDESTAPGEVGEKGNSSMFSCPFHLSDSRGFRDVRAQIKGHSVTRKYVRIALHNLYAGHHTLESFADGLVNKANSSAFKPFSTDTAWFQAYARNIDCILLNNLEGPWVSWNEPCLDEMVIGLLELAVRIAPHKEYPACLDDQVRKWMKKKRIGTNTKYGPVFYAMQHAKFTESGLVLLPTSRLKAKELPFVRNTFPSFQPKSSTSTPGGNDKKSPPPTHT